jgi:hypothetical protein
MLYRAHWKNKRPANIMWYCLSMTSGRSLVFSVYSVQHYVILFVNDLRQVSCFFSVLCTTLCDTVCQWLAAGLLFFQCALYNIMWYCLSMTCGRSLVFSVYSVQHYVILFVNDLRKVSCFFSVLCITLCDTVCQWLAAGLLYFQCTLYSIMWYSLSMTCGRPQVIDKQYHIMLYRVHWKNKRPSASHWQTVSHNVVQSTLKKSETCCKSLTNFII